MNVFFRDRARASRRAAVGVLAASLLASVIGLAPAAHADANVDGGCTSSDLRTAVDSLNGPGTNSITLHKNCKYVFTGQDMSAGPSDAALVVSTQNLTIYGNGATIVVSQKGADLRHFNVINGATLSLQDITLTGGDIENEPTCNTCGFAGGTAVAGSILAAGGTTVNGLRLTVKGNKVRGIDIVADVVGGAIASDGAVNLTKSTISGNSLVSLGAISNGAGGGLAIGPGGSANLSNSTVQGNSVTVASPVASIGIGGGIWNSGDSITLSGTSLSGNKVSASSGLISFTAGGGLYNDMAGGGSRDASITGSKFDGNTVTASGPVSIAAGGGLYDAASNTFYVDSDGSSATGKVTNITNNTASCTSSFCVALGGGAFDDDDVAYGGTVFKGNTASAKSGASLGGGLAVLSSTTDLFSATITKNTASGKFVSAGGGVALLGGTVNVHDSEIVKNKPDNCFHVLGCIG